MIQSETNKRNRLIESKDFNRFYVFKKVKQPIKCSNPTMKKILFNNIDLLIHIKYVIKIHKLHKANKIKDYNEKTINTLNEYNYMKENHLLMLKETERIMNAINQKNKRFYKKVKRIIELSHDSCLMFATLTFHDNVFSRMNELSRKRTITRLLKKYCIDYIGNIDYGTLNEREHYHFILRFSTFEQAKQLSKDYYQTFNSTIYNENIVNYNSKGIAKYISKLTNHALKESTKRINQFNSHLIYSRETRHEITINE